MLHEKSCGAIVYRKSHGNTEILLIKHVNSGHWSFPKGHVEGNETELETAQREIMEETGIDVILDPTFRETVSYSPKKDTNKVVVYFLAKAKNFDYVPQEEEIAEIRCCLLYTSTNRAEKTQCIPAERLHITAMQVLLTLPHQ